MKKTAWVVIVSLVMSGTTWAQVQVNKTVVCVRPSSVPVDQWNLMNSGEQAQACETSEVPDYRNTQSGAVIVKPHKVKISEPVSRGVGITGVLVTLVGVGLVVPHGDTYHILGDTYCVNTYSVDYGGCGPGVTEAQIGMILIGSGVLIAWLGLRDKWVTVSPTLSPKALGATATVKWGGSHVK